MLGHLNRHRREWRWRRSRGFTLTELLTVIVILLVLLLLAGGAFRLVQRHGWDNSAKQYLLLGYRSLQDSVNDSSLYPSDLVDLLNSDHPPVTFFAVTDPQAACNHKGEVAIDTTRSDSNVTVLYVCSQTGKIFEIVATPKMVSPTIVSLDTLTGEAPQPAAKPELTGRAMEGKTLLATSGGWSSADAPAYSYQWRRCDSQGNNCFDISGASSSSYTLTGADVNETVRVIVTATNSSGSFTATSDASPVVEPAPTVGPSDDIPPTIGAGLVEEYETLTGNQGSWTGHPPINLSFQWLRCDTSGANCSNIAGATSKDYTLTSADVGSTIRFQVVGTDQQGTTTAQTGQTAVVKPAPPTNTALPVISGTAQDMQTLTTSNGTWKGSGLTYTYQWERCDPSGSSCAYITGANMNTYVVESVDVGETLRSVVTANNSSGTASATSNQTAVVAGAPPASTAAPTISGSAIVGQNLTASNGAWSGTPTIAYAYQWRRCDSIRGSCTNIAGATSSSYTVAALDAGGTLRVRVTASNPYGSTIADSQPTAAIPPAPGTVSISGNPVVGQTLTANVSGWQSSTAITYSYQWQSCDSSGANCADIAGATSQSYTPVSSDVGSTLRVVATGTNSGGSATATSNATAAVTRGVAAGVIVPYAGTLPAPSGWALADGSCGYTSSSYPDLWAVIGTTYGGSGSSNFCLPDLRGRMALGKASSGTGSTLGATGGQMDQAGTLEPWGASLGLNFNWTETPPNPPAIAHSHSYTSGYRSNQSTGSRQFYYLYATDVFSIAGSANESWTGQATPISASASVAPTATYTVSNPSYRIVRYLISLQAGAAPCGALWGYGAAAPSGAGLADGTTSSSCLDSAYSGRLPDLRGSLPLGQAASGSYSILNAAGGAINQTVSGSLNTTSTQTTVTPAAWTGSVVENSHTHPYNAPTFGWLDNYHGGSIQIAEQTDSHGTPVPQITIGANSNAGTVYTSNTYSPGALTTSFAPADSPVSAAFETSYQTVNWIGYSGSGYALAPGTISAYAGATAPSGWLSADGSCYSTSTYAGLFNVIGYTYGGSGTSFCVPDLRGRFPLGKASTGTGSTLGATGGSLAPAPTLTFSGWTPQMSIPAHTFSWTIPSHTHTFSGAGDVGATCYWWQSGSTCENYGVLRSSGTTNSAGGGTITSNIAAYNVSGTAITPATVTPSVASPPYVAVNYIIKS